MAGTISVEHRDRVLLATLANPPHGLMDDSIVAELEALVARADADPGIGGVVLTGAHPSRFLAHYDVGELLEVAKESPSVAPGLAKPLLRAAGAVRRVPRAAQALENTPVAGLVALERFHAVLLGMERSSAVWIAALNGSAQGGGCELSLACDFRFMAAGDHRIGQPEILFGFPPGGGGTQRLTRMLGTTRALRLILDGGPLSPDEAAELGIVDRVVDSGELLDAALAEAQRLGSRPKLAIGAAKRAVYEGGSLPLPDGLRLERAEFLATLPTPDAIAAMQAYVDATERTGELPGYDAEARAAALERGHFA